MTDLTPGYDDESTIPRSRLRNLIKEVERGLSEDCDVSAVVESLEETALELGDPAAAIGRQLCDHYKIYRQERSEANAEKLRISLENLLLSLT